jgi:hypothetical protein
MLFAIENTFPSPAVASTTIRYSLTESAVVRVSIFDRLGRSVLEVPGLPSTPGQHELQLDLGSLRPGVYVSVVQAGDQVASRPIAIVR